MGIYEMGCKEDIERALVEAGWKLDGGFSRYLVIGENHDLTILVPRWAWEARDPAFELCGAERSLIYWIRKIPTPRQTATLLDAHGEPPEEERGKPYELDPAGG